MNGMKAWGVTGAWASAHARMKAASGWAAGKPKAALDRFQ